MHKHFRWQRPQSCSLSAENVPFALWSTTKNCHWIAVIIAQLFQLKCLMMRIQWRNWVTAATRKSLKLLSARKARPFNGGQMYVIEGKQSGVEANRPFAQLYISLILRISVVGLIGIEHTQPLHLDFVLHHFIISNKSSSKILPSRALHARFIESNHETRAKI